MIDRRHVLTLLGATLASPAFAQAPAMSRPTAYAFSFTTLDSRNVRLAEYAAPQQRNLHRAEIVGGDAALIDIDEGLARLRHAAFDGDGAPRHHAAQRQRRDSADCRHSGQ